MARKVRYEEMLPHEMERAVRRSPIAYLPCGTLEWHGVHLALGNDAVKAHELSLRCAAKSGGVVTPANYWAVGGLHQPWTLRPEAEGIYSQLVTPILENVFRELERVGFRVIICITGHYGMGQILAVKRAALTQMYNGNAVVYALAEYEVATDLGYHGDHAAKWETSILWYLRPDLVDMERLPKDLSKKLIGVGGEDPRTSASRKLGREIVSGMVERIGEKAQEFLGYGAGKRRLFIKACERQYEFLTLWVRAVKTGARAPEELHGLRGRYNEEVLPALQSGEYGKVISTLDRANDKLANWCSQVEAQGAGGGSGNG